MKFLFRVNKPKVDQQADEAQDVSKALNQAVSEYTKALNEASVQFNKSRSKAEEEIQRGARITKHRINL